MVDINVGISDTEVMMNIAHSVSVESEPLTLLADPSSAAGDAAFDALGMPNTVAAAKCMTLGMIEAALVRAIAELHHEPIAAVSATAPIDSLEIVFAMGRFYRHLGGLKQPNLSNIHSDYWSSLSGAADVLFHIMEETK